MTDFFRLQYAGLAIVLLLVSGFLNNEWAGTFNAATVVVNLWRIRAFLPFSQRGKINAKKDLLSVNAFKDNKKVRDLEKILADAEPELLLLMEINPELEQKLSDIMARYPYRMEEPVREGFKICLLSKAELENRKVTRHGPGDTPLLHAQVTLSGKRYQVFSAHPKPAFNREWDKERHIYFSDLQDIVKRAELPVIVMGDFNAVPWENHFVKFLENTRLVSTLTGCGYKITWPTYLPLLGVPMDHILLSDTIACRSLDIGPYANSDHFPIALDLCEARKS